MMPRLMYSDRKGRKGTQLETFPARIVEQMQERILQRRIQRERIDT